jgi:hypothetical protein
MKLDFLMSDDQNKIYDFLPLLVIFGAMILTSMNFIPVSIKPFILFGSLGGFFAVTFFAETLLERDAGQYLAIEATVFPLKRKLNLFVRIPHGGQTSTCIDPQKNIWSTPVELGRPINYEPYNKISKMIWKHEYPWSRRMMGEPNGKVTYKGVPGINHSNLAIGVILWEPEVVKGHLDDELLEFVPEFTLIHAPLDSNIASEPPTLQIYEAGVNTLPTTENRDLALELVTEKAAKQKAINECESWKSKYYTVEQGSIRVKGFVNRAVNALFGSYGAEPDIDKLVQARFVTLLHAVNDIKQAAGMFGNKWFKITRNVVILVAVVLGLYVFSTNAEIRTQIFSNIWPIVIGAVAITVLFLYLTKQRD